jgi:NADH-quinone oxidoreductase subunit J
MNADAFIFWFLAIVTLFAGATVIMISSPVFSALALAMAMVGVGALFVTLNAYFLAGVQLIVYAGAVMVLFVMVLMLFDLKNEINVFAKGKFSGALKVAAVGVLAGLFVGTILSSGVGLVQAADISNLVAANGDNTKSLGKMLFSQYIFGFEVLGALLLVVAIGAVALSRAKGGTHDKH